MLPPPLRLLPPRPPSASREVSPGLRPRPNFRSSIKRS
jgi:hypothetical protein